MVSHCSRTVLQFHGSLFREPNTAGQMCTSPHSMTEELKMYLPSAGSFLVGLFSFAAVMSRGFFLPPLLRALFMFQVFENLSIPPPPHTHTCVHTFPYFRFPGLLESRAMSGPSTISCHYEAEWACEEGEALQATFQSSLWVVFTMNSGKVQRWREVKPLDI